MKGNEGFREVLRWPITGGPLTIMSFPIGFGRKRLEANRPMPLKLGDHHQRPGKYDHTISLQ